MPNYAHGQRLLSLVSDNWWHDLRLRANLADFTDVSSIFVTIHGCTLE